jgi:hypothetical protein
MSKPVRVYMGIPSLGERLDAQVYALREMEKAYAGRVELVYPSKFVGRIFHDYARNCYVEDFLKSDCDILWFLDSDILPRPNTLDLITEHGDKWKLAGCPYPVFMTPKGYETPQVVFTVYRWDGKGMQPAAIPDQGHDFVDGIATGCIFIRREVLEGMAKPYFEFTYDPETREIIHGEDLGFCKKTQAAGHQFFIDFSMVANHYKKVSLFDVNNYAMEYAQSMVMAYDRSVRSELVKTHLNLGKPAKSKIITL